jgi:hypothetical protein
MTNAIENLRQAPIVCRDRCNAAWLIKRHEFITPAPFGQTQLQLIAKAA